MKQRPGNWFIALALTALAGCSQFDRQWELAGNRVETGIEGRWVGRWVSDVDGHSGELRCAVRRDITNQYVASFSGTFWQVFGFAYDAPLHGRTNDGQVELAGEQDLGFPMGVFLYDGYAGDNRFFLTYRSKYDGGHFVMSRP